METQPAKRRRNDVETTSEHVVESTSKKGWKRKWNRRWEIDVVSTLGNRRRYEVGISTLFLRCIFDVVSTLNNRWKCKWNQRWNVDVISTYLFRSKLDHLSKKVPASQTIYVYYLWKAPQLQFLFWNVYSHM